MPFDVHGALLVAVVAGVTALIRFLPNTDRKSVV